MPATMPNDPPLLFINVGWMTDYGGRLATDRTTGGFAYLKDHDHGAEASTSLP